MSVRVRIAPSPTGNLHIGTARTAIFNYLFARHQGGKLILRVEDTDRERSQPRYTRSILQGLAWLGIDFDEGPVYQSERFSRYAQVVRQLLDAGSAYHCYTSESELEALRNQQRARGQAPRYDNRHRDLSDDAREAYVLEGREPVIRFRIEEPREVRWHDLVRGELVWNTADLGGDMVIARADGQPLYNLAVVVDDLDMEISHVIRGEDHIGNTPKQILLYRALGVEPPVFGHVPLIFSPQGRKLSKREGATSVSDFERMGYLPEAMANYLALMSWTPPETEEIFSLDEAARHFDLERVSRSPARFDWDKLTWLNGQYLRAMDTGELIDRLIPFWLSAGYTITPLDRPWLEALTTLVGEGLHRLNEVGGVTHYFFAEEIGFKPDALAILHQPATIEILKGFAGAVQELDRELNRRFLEQWDQFIWHDDPTDLYTRLFTEQLAPRDALAKESPPEHLTRLGSLLTDLRREAAERLPQLLPTVAKGLGLKKGALMKPLRCALTGETHGPDLIQSLILLHRRGKALSRLERAIELNPGLDT